MNREERQARFEGVDLYPVTCAALSAGRDDLFILDRVIAGGAKIIQLREKALSKRAFFELAKAFRRRCSEAGILFMVNDHVDVALAAGADGVHLGQEDLPVAEARRLGPELLIGVSTHNREEALAAWRDGADYYNIGPIYPTRTKEGAPIFLGPDAVRAISRDIPLPFTVMGGIKMVNLHPLLATGARRIAVVTAVTQAPDPAAAVRELITAIRSGAGGAPPPDLPAASTEGSD